MHPYLKGIASKSTVISVRGLSKAYTLNHNAEQHTLLGEALTSRLRHPLRRPERETFWALRDVDFDVDKGDVVGIIGRNGAGKSTLLKILSRIVEPTSGEVRLNGRVGSLLEVGTGFHPELTGRENIFLNGALLGMKRREIVQQFDAIVSFAEVERFLDTPVKRYSSGMYVRLAFAVAAHLNPSILLVDEVLAVGDAEFQNKCLGKMEDVSRQHGRTVLFVSHNEAAVRRLCRTAILLQEGAVATMGTPEEAFRAYRTTRQTDGFDRSHRIHASRQLQIVGGQLTVDGAPTMELVAGQHPLLTLSVCVAEACKFSIEALVRDNSSVPIMFAPIGLATGLEYFLPPGVHQLSYCLEFPILATGKYTIDLMLAETNVRFYDYIEEALSFVVSPSHNANTGWLFTQTHGQGCILLNATETEADCQVPTGVENHTHRRYRAAR